MVGVELVGNSEWQNRVDSEVFPTSVSPMMQTLISMGADIVELISSVMVRRNAISKKSYHATFFLSDEESQVRGKFCLIVKMKKFRDGQRRKK